VGDERRDGSIRYLLVRVMRPHDTIHIANKNRLNLERAKFAVFATGMIVSVRFDLNQGRKKQWMHDLMRDRVLFVGFDAREGFTG
jgi:hypothetical protein